MKLKNKQTIQTNKPSIAFNPFGVVIVGLETIVTIVIYGFTDLLPKLLKSLGWDVLIKHWISTPSSGPWLSLLIFLAGVQLFKFKQSNQFWYGISEVGFAISSYSYFLITIRLQILDKGFGTASWISLIGALYLIVRGNSNIHDGLKSEKGFWKKSWVEKTINKQNRLIGSM
ncbi:hypothetical protein [Spirosoma jeollabukense]